MELQDETNRLLACLIRLQKESQAETIAELDKHGIAAGRIADLLGTTPATARDAIKRQKTRTRKGKANG